MNEQLRDEINQILEQADQQQDAGHSSAGEQPQPTEHKELYTGEDCQQQQQEHSQMPPRVVNVYLVSDTLSAVAGEDDALPEDLMWTVESTFLPSDRDAAETISPASSIQTEEEPAPPTMPSSPPVPSGKHGIPVRLWTVAGLCLFALLLGGIAYLTAFLLATADVTIIPVAQAISTTSTVTVVTAGVPDQAHQQVAGRLLPMLSMSQAKTIPTTGTGHQQAQAAHGSVTFYNAALSQQIIPAGTLLTGADGTEIVTEQDAVISAGSLAVNGEVTVAAHAVQVGPAGNIRAGDIYGPCCRLNVFAANGPFSGGQNARDYPMVTQQDLDGIVSTLKADLSQSIQAAFQAQVHADETLITPVPCTPTVTADHQAGEEARQVSVTVSQTCTGATYTTQGLQTLMTQGGNLQAAKQLGQDYALVGTMQVKVISVGTMSKAQQQKPGTLTVQVKATGTWAYQFSEAQLHTLSSMIAGKSTGQAIVILLRQTGVSQVMLHVSGDKTSLPASAGNIHILVMYTPMQ